MKKAVKDAGKTVAKAVAEVKEAAPKAVKAAEKAVKAVEEKVEKKAEKEETKKPAKAPAKTAVKKTVLKEEVYLQCFGKEVSKDELMKQVKEIWTKQMKNKVGDMKSVTLYLKPEESKAYFVINGDVTGSIDF